MGNSQTRKSNKQKEIALRKVMKMYEIKMMMDRKTGYKTSWLC